MGGTMYDDNDPDAPELHDDALDDGASDDHPYYDDWDDSHLAMYDDDPSPYDGTYSEM